VLTTTRSTQGLCDSGNHERCRTGQFSSLSASPRLRPPCSLALASTPCRKNAPRTAAPSPPGRTPQVLRQPRLSSETNSRTPCSPRSFKSRCRLSHSPWNKNSGWLLGLSQGWRCNRGTSLGQDETIFCGRQSHGSRWALKASESLAQRSHLGLMAISESESSKLCNQSEGGASREIPRAKFSLGS
jgi:hypothetical protein